MNKIVFVEDDPEVGTLIAAYLGKHDMDVVVEPRGDRAEEVIAREKPDLVLLDIMLPGKDGMTLCRDLRGQWQGPIVLLTSLDSDMNHILSLEMGASDYILKTTPPAGTSRATASAFAPAYCSGRRRIRLLNAHAT
ncbi:DNA-binding transcriptional regulator RstA [Klebsiella pneumoniae]|uniref:DNA-binding transcriptional regulator RstA n=1 Tax=Klebsiella pneumoniae TaxID=573 RepID=A0A377XT11_KLEPN|nr:DNA-binding transcriptional regulator RstA [Klebsiella pneumoniae]